MYHVIRVEADIAKLVVCVIYYVLESILLMCSYKSVAGVQTAQRFVKGKFLGYSVLLL